MSETIHFDTHRFIKRMTEAGMAEQTAEALADEQMRLIQGELATKQDIKQLEQATKQDTKQDIKQLAEATKRDLAATEANLRLEIERVRSDLLRWMAGMLIAQGAVVVGLIQLLAA